jgi:hypothetical protein
LTDKGQEGPDSQDKIHGINPGKTVDEIIPQRQIFPAKTVTIPVKDQKPTEHEEHRYSDMAFIDKSGKILAECRPGKRVEMTEVNHDGSDCPDARQRGEIVLVNRSLRYFLPGRHRSHRR